ncbi:zf-TFIIB domain-containing protein [Lentzea sp. DG1S-22]|uniref:TFIIB-type zinc ribbon-containing protein n=1 Tax=Lentzea sp. DG1S-22 TaxID=3108822 RepID=UPI002E781F72|nr:zf-TFIIB domain-containing protein [Lentzea sp. DG1S-22]WVH83023.1 zf-TFIIB domain-containing protein [Lentzea sp. DG1S-22]
MICPKCHHAMRTFDRDGIHLEQCENCKGIYLDAGELEQILLTYRTHLQSAGHQQATPAPPPYRPAPMSAPHHPAPPPREKKDDFWGDDDDDFFGTSKDSRGKKKKKDKWGFLDDIFG